MSDLRELYQALIIDHGRNPRCLGELPKANCIAEGFNPLCGDQLTLYLQVDMKSSLIQAIRFQGTGCAISMASASLMAEHLQGKTLTEVSTLFEAFQIQMTQEVNEETTQQLGKLTALSGVREFPARVKCATLAWHTLRSALNNNDSPVSTEETKSDLL